MLGDPRKRLRSRHLHGRELQVGCGEQSLPATIVDSSEEGLGVHVLRLMPIGECVSFVGAGLEGRARVKYCRRADNGIVRLGLALEEVKFCQVPSLASLLTLTALRQRF